MGKKEDAVPGRELREAPCAACGCFTCAERRWDGVTVQSLLSSRA